MDFTMEKIPLSTAWGDKDCNYPMKRTIESGTPLELFLLECPIPGLAPTWIRYCLQYIGYNRNVIYHSFNYHVKCMQYVFHTLNLYRKWVIIIEQEIISFEQNIEQSINLFM
jgi:hypothetical protein